MKITCKKYENKILQRKTHKKKDNEKSIPVSKSKEKIFILVKPYSCHAYFRRDNASLLSLDLIKNATSARGFNFLSKDRILYFNISKLAYIMYPSLVLNSISGLNRFFCCFSSNLHVGIEKFYHTVGYIKKVFYRKKNLQFY